MAGLMWLRWCWQEARLDLVDEHPGTVRARMLGWYERHIDRAEAYRGNRGCWWRGRTR